MIRCGECGSKELTKRDQQGRAFKFRDYPAVFLRASFSILECDRCHNHIMNAAEIERLDDLLVKSICNETRNYIDRVVSREICDQEVLAEHLGITPEYLSTLKSGAKIPKFQVFNFLKTLAFSLDAFVISDPIYNPSAFSSYCFGQFWGISSANSLEFPFLQTVQAPAGPETRVPLELVVDSGPNTILKTGN